MAGDTGKNLKKLRIGILTFWWSQDNYGQLLQCYALQKYLRDAGHDAFLIRYDPENDFARTPLWKRILKAFNPVLLFNYLNLKNRKRLSRAEQKQHSRRFDEFRTKYIVQSEKIYRSYSELKESPPEADCYIVGSDQVWSFTNYPIKRITGKIHTYMLDFGTENVLRISYAASWSVLSLSYDLVDEITPLLKKFNYVSVREKTGIQLCKQCGRDDSEWICDPTMLLSADEYRELYKERRIAELNKKYILLYMLNNKNDFDITSVYRFAKEHFLEVIYITGNGVVDRYKKCFATIQEWLYLIDNAEYIITNSFHCCVFSLIFNKNFGAVALSKEHSRMNVRLDSLWEQCGIVPRYIQNYDFSILNKSCFPIEKRELPEKLMEILNGKK